MENQQNLQPDNSLATQNPAHFDDYRKELWGGLKAAHEQFDKAIITLSSGGLAISLTLIKDFFEAENMLFSRILISGWFLFCFAIMSTVISFLTSQKSINVQLDYFEKYAAGDASYYNKKNPYIIVTTWLNMASGLFFLLAVIGTTTFTTINLIERVKHVQKVGRFEQGNSNSINAVKTTSHGRFSPATNAASNSKSNSGIPTSTIKQTR